MKVNCECNLLFHFKYASNNHSCRTRLCGTNFFRLVENRGFEFEGFKFNFGRYALSLEFELCGKLEDERLPRILEKLFKSMVLWEREPDFSEILQGV